MQIIWWACPYAISIGGCIKYSSKVILQFFGCNPYSYCLMAACLGRHAIEIIDVSQTEKNTFLTQTL